MGLAVHAAKPQGVKTIMSKAFKEMKDELEKFLGDDQIVRRRLTYQEFKGELAKDRPIEKGYLIEFITSGGKSPSLYIDDRDMEYEDVKKVFDLFTIEE